MNKQIRLFIMRLLYIAFLGVVLPVNANIQSNRFYHKIGYSVSPKGAGTVYANGPTIVTDYILYVIPYYYNASHDYEETTSNQEKTATLSKYEWDFDNKPQSVDMIYTLHASNTNNRYQFDHWEKKNGNTWQIIQQDEVSLDYTAPTVTVSNTSSNPSISASYRAVFSLKGVLKAEVATGQENLGNVINSKVDNQAGDNVTLTARSTQSFRGVTFSHWTIDGNNVYRSEENPLKVTVPNVESIVYRAHFTEPSNYSYCRFENVATGKFISLYSRDVSTIGESSMTVNALKLLNSTTSMGDPSTVFYVAGTSDNLEGLSAVSLLQSQGVDLKSEVLSSYSLKFTKEGEYYHISTMYNNTQFYLTDNNSSNPIFTNSQGNKSLWKVHFLDEDHVGEHAFGVAPDSRMYQNGKYYTTLYTTFPYKMLDGIKAYYLDIMRKDEIYNEKSKKITFLEADNEDKIIPKNMAVILECSGTSPEGNRLLPIVDKNNSIGEGKYVTDKNNPLKGALVIGGNLTGAEAAAKRHLNQDYVYVYSAKNGHVSFYTWTGNKVIPNNKVYLAVTKDFEGESSSDGNAAKGYTFVWGTTTGIDNTAVKVEEDGAIYNLQGSKVTNPSAGVYIKNGKKFVVK